jgi:PQQ-dependent dehydrogenase (methanol/ethanol family)
MHSSRKAAFAGGVSLVAAAAFWLTTTALNGQQSGQVAGHMQTPPNKTGVANRSAKAPAPPPNNPANTNAPGTVGNGIQYQPEDGQWTMPGKNYALTRFSGLTEITPANVANLKMAWTVSTGTTRGYEAPALVVNDTLYSVTPFPNIAFAIDLKNPQGPMKWKFDPDPDRASQGVACCDVVNRGPVYSNGHIYFNTLDDHTWCLDANTGKPVWNTKLDDINTGSTITGAPLVVKNVVIVGNSGADLGVRGWIAGLDAGSGKVLWRAYHTGPDKDILIGPNFHPFYPGDNKPDLGENTWPAGAWKIGGGSMWGWISYDPQMDLIFYGSANPAPWNPSPREGDDKWTNTVFARRPETGEAIWAYQYNPFDQHDYDGINEHILADLTIDGKLRKLILHPDRNGRMYVFDRTTGQVISANPFSFINTTTPPDPKTGRLTVPEDKHTGTGRTTRDICPAFPGGKDWQPSAFSPVTNLMYIPHQNLCQDFTGIQPNFISGTPYIAGINRDYAGPGGFRGLYTAYDPVKAKVVWDIREKFPVWSGTVVTATNVAFYGTMDGWFKAVDARDGHLLWQFKTGNGIISQPTIFRGPDGKEYVAVFGGVGGWTGAIVAGGLDPADPTGAAGTVGAMTDLPQYVSAGGALYVFSLP